MAPLQKRALYQLVAASAGVLLLVALVIFAGMSTAVLVLILPVFVLAYWVPRYLTRPRPDQPVIMDERDKAILSQVPRYQRFGIMLGVVVWSAVVVFSSDTRDQVTIGPASLVWLANSVVIADNVFSVVGTLIEYWRTEQHGQG